MTRADEIEIAAAAIANARGGRRGMPPIKNILDMLPAKLRDEVRDDAAAVFSAIDQARNNSGTDNEKTAP